MPVSSKREGRASRTQAVFHQALVLAVRELAEEWRAKTAPQLAAAAA
jgi:hypothetical protein